MSFTGGGFKNVLVIGADALSRYVDWTDRGTCILFGDAAGAVLLQVIGLEVLASLEVFYFWYPLFLRVKFLLHLRGNFMASYNFIG